MSKHIKDELVDIEVIIFKYLIYIFLIILSYKLSTAIAVSYGIFPENTNTGLAIIILGPLYLIIFIPILLAISAIFITVSYYFFNKSSYFKNFIVKTISFSDATKFGFWILLGLLPYMSLSYFDTFIEKNRKEGYQNRKEHIKKVEKSNQKRREDYKIEVKSYTKDEALASVKKGEKTLEYMSSDLKKDKEIVYEAVKQNPYYGLKYADESFRRDRELILMAVKQNAQTFCQANSILRKDKTLLLTVMESPKYSSHVLQCADRSLKKDKEVALASIRKNPSTFHVVDKSLKKDREVALEAIKREGFLLSSVDRSLKKDREFVLIAVKQSGYALDYIDRSLKDDREIVLAAVKANGGALRYATSKQKADREIVLMAVRNEKDGFSDALGYADISLINDKEIALAAVRHNGLSLEHVGMSLKNDREVVLAALKQNRHAIIYAHKNLQDELK